ncbi:MAG: hypothetical protein U1F76_25890 [Candidatus Competibacteraceae bacterium]
MNNTTAPRSMLKKIKTPRFRCKSARVMLKPNNKLDIVNFLKEGVVMLIDLIIITPEVIDDIKKNAPGILCVGISVANNVSGVKAIIVSAIKPALLLNKSEVE